MEVEYKGIKLKGLTENYPFKQHQLMASYLEGLLWPLGEPKVVGSFRRKVSYKDIDVTLHTNIKTQKTLIRFIEDHVKPKWLEVSDLPIDIFVYGMFESEVIKMQKYTLYLDRKEKQIWRYLKVMSLKLLRSLSKT